MSIKSGKTVAVGGNKATAERNDRTKLEITKRHQRQRR